MNRRIILGLVMFLSVGLFILQLLLSFLYDFDLSKLSLEFWLANLTYYFTFSLSICSLFLYKKKPVLVVGGELLHKSKCRISRISIWLSIVGIICMFIDRAYFRGVDYLSLSFVEVRNMLNENSDSRVGVSSIFSVIGNLLQYLFFYTLIYLVYYSRKSFKQEYITYFGLLICIVLSSFLLGGRSIVMLVLLFSISLLLMKFIDGRINLKVSRVLIICFWGGGFFLSVIFIFGFVFYKRSQVGGVDLFNYFIAVSEHLQVPIESEQGIEGNSFISTVYYIFGMIVMYLAHPLWFMNDIITSDSGSGYIFISTPILMLNKIIGFELTAHEYAGYFIPVPGALYYDFGVVGIILSPIILGCGVAFSIHYWSCNKVSFFRVFLLMSALSFLIFSPVLVLTNFIIFLIISVMLCCLDLVFSKRYNFK